ncbi:MAG: hypothetical protein K1W13_09645 [Lachnospiraceae bacterium]
MCIIKKSSFYSANHSTVKEKRIERQKRKGLQKALSVFLSMALLVGILSNAAPIHVRASGEVVLTVGADIEITESIAIKSGSTVTLLSAGNHTLKRASGYSGTMFAV